MTTRRVSEAEFEAFKKQPLSEEDKRRNAEVLARSRVARDEERVRFANQQELEKQRAKRGEQATTPDSKESVPRKTKEEQRNTANGGAITRSVIVTPTDFIPNPNKKPATIAPDYYRDGFLRSVTNIVQDQEIITHEWAPVPHLIGERARPLLASIRLIDTRNLNAEDPNKAQPEPIIPEFSKFFLDTVQEMNQEKMQVVETFSDWYVFFYGERPAQYTFSGYLLNTHNYNWWNEFVYYYQNFWRGTQSVRNGAKVFLTYNYQQVQGYVMNMSANLSAATDKMVPFSISVLVTKRLIFSGTKDDGVIRDSLLPRSDTGLINASSNSKIAVKTLTREFLQKNEPASSNKAISASNASDAKQVLDGKLPSVKPQDYMKINGGGLQQGSSLASGLRLA